MKTPTSLLERLRQPSATSPDDWILLVKLYTPLLFYFAKRMGLQDADAADLVQEVLTVLFQKLPNFEYDPKQSFRAWLRTVTLRKWAEKQRGRRPLPLPAEDEALAALAAPDAIKAFEENDFRQYVAQRALILVQAEFEPSTWTAFWEVMVKERPVCEVAAELSVKPAVVYTAKSRVLRRLRREFKGLFD